MLENYTHPPGTQVLLPIHIQSQFEALKHMLPTQMLDQEALGHCQKALTELEEIYKNIVYFSQTSNIDMGHVSQWQAKVTMGYVLLSNGSRR
jgi:hypothetical protein